MAATTLHAVDLFRTCKLTKVSVAISLLAAKCCYDQSVVILLV